MKIKSTLLFDKIENALANGAPFACYRFPDKQELRAFFQNNKRVYKSARFKESGFVFAPFNNRETAIVIPSDKAVFYRSNYTAKVRVSKHVEVGDHSNAGEEDGYKKMINACIQYLNTSETKKVVLSRRLAIKVKMRDAVTIFKNLLSIYESAMVYLWYHPKFGLWMGASPETLLRLNGTAFETMSLAGTRAYSANKKIAWNFKEIREQQYVTDFILAQLASRVSALERMRTTTKIAGTVAHRCTKVRGVLAPSQTLYGVLSKLHPTPAVCGLPQDTAKDYILRNEGYDRKFYTGFLGEININQSTNLFVNLRCIELLEEMAYIYVGGGITADSEADSEWNETVEKSKVIKKALAIG